MLFHCSQNKKLTQRLEKKKSLLKNFNRKISNNVEMFLHFLTKKVNNNEYLY
jgi:hypothetical protein